MKNEFSQLKQLTSNSIQQLQSKVVGKETLAEIINSKENYIREELEKLRKELPGKPGPGQIGWGSTSSQDRDIIINRVEGLLKAYKESIKKEVSDDVQRLLAEERRESQAGIHIHNTIYCITNMIWSILYGPYESYDMADIDSTLYDTGYYLDRCNLKSL